MKIYKILSALLCYPQADLQAGIAEIRTLLADEYADFSGELEPLLSEIEQTDLISLQ